MRMSRATIAIALTPLWAAALAGQAAAQEVCGNDVKLEVVNALSKYDDPTSKDALAAQQELYKKLEYCLKEPPKDNQPAARLRARACGKIPFVGSLYWEQMPCCGYDPQEYTFACPIEILRDSGFGAPAYPGSFEHVLVCVDYGAGLVPVARDWVHLADNISGTRPIWNFAALPKVFDQGFLAQHFDNLAYPARAVLSWSIEPADCQQTPIWGHAVDFKIRLDK
ncbi:MAG TPA: hypothetical protein VJV78_35795 [Polyangiales bacterium]|nr:hypothetical protein [Polyangiales bacterium]